MSTTATTAGAQASLQEFDRTTSRWGQLTMLAALLLSLAGPFYLVFFADLGVTGTMVWTAALAVGAAFFVLWFVEPITYYPVLGPAAMYQAFMIGNIANKLLPSAMVAQATIGAKPGTKKADFSALMAICGAAMVHVFSMLVFVGLLGTWLLTLIPVEVMDVARLYIFPSIIGAVLVQLVVSAKQPRVTIIAVGVAMLVVFVLVPMFPAIAKLATGITVVATAALAWFARSRNDAGQAPELVN
ncbi:hypothetical protein [Arthrobacter sp.]|uniref:hypothetical protein n=1 Tax=Arthrobacter sp. TaxID=1667 RepID=UPI0028A001DB|nr:hypothetical protein [Arthrobacter sp.]